MNNEQLFLNQALEFCLYCGSKRVAVCPDAEKMKFFVCCHDCFRESVREKNVKQAVFSWLERRLIEKTESGNDRTRRTCRT